MIAPRLPRAHETPTPPGEGEPFIVLLAGDGYEEGERMAVSTEGFLPAKESGVQNIWR